MIKYGVTFNFKMFIITTGMLGKWFIVLYCNNTHPKKNKSNSLGSPSVSISFWTSCSYCVPAFGPPPDTTVKWYIQESWNKKIWHISLTLHKAGTIMLQSSFTPTKSVWCLLVLYITLQISYGTLLYLLLFAWHQQVCRSLVSWKYTNSKVCAVSISFLFFTVRVRHVINLLHTRISHVDLTNWVLE